MSIMETVWMWVRISVVLVLAIVAIKEFGPTTEKKAPSPKEDKKAPDNENWLKLVQAAIDISKMVCEMMQADESCMKRSASLMMESMIAHNVEMERKLKAINVDMRQVGEAMEMLRRIIDGKEDPPTIDQKLFDEDTQQYGPGVCKDQPLNGSQTAEMDGLQQSCRMAEAPSHAGSNLNPSTGPPVEMSESAQPTSKCRRVACDPVGIPMSGDARQP